MGVQTEARRPPPEEDSIDDATRRFLDLGFIGEFSIVGPRRMRCGACREEPAAGEVKLLALERVDVATDPDDQSVVTALECPRCGARGVHVFSFGPTASMEDKSCFAALRNERGVGAA
ncbi:MAG: hypothetical protein HYT80_07440 [Euryarchaeota archaeon]|nr:hypothetical protein [Euryarchaeota archaeon]